MRLAVAAETAAGERRVAVVPDSVRRLVAAGWDVSVERGAGAGAFVPDEALAAAGARIVDSVTDVVAAGDVDLLLGVQPPPLATLSALRPGAGVVSLLAPATFPEHVRRCRDRGLTAFAMELVPRLSRAQPMDVLTSQALVAGYRGALTAAALSPVFFPGATTAAGTIPPARVLVLGTGVAGLEAIATARRLGATVTAHDVRPSSAKEVASVGGTLLSFPTGRQDQPGGYARMTSPDLLAAHRVLLAPHVAAADAVVTTAVAPGLPAPLLLTAEMVGRMRPGSVVVDLAAEAGGNCALTRPGEQVVQAGVVVAGPRDVAAGLPRHASELFARNVAELVLLMTVDGVFAPDRNDAVLAGCRVTMDGSGPPPAPSQGDADADPPEETVRSPRLGSVEDVADRLTTSRTVVVVPGYGLARSGAEHALRTLGDLLAARGTEVVYALHPVAGRLPGHLDLLLDRAGVPPAQILDLERANRRFPDTDLVLVVGANDVVNPTAAEPHPRSGSALAGMPVLEVAAARQVVVLDRDPGPGFAGVGNPLFASERVVVLPGDAAETLVRLLAAVQRPGPGPRAAPPGERA